MLLAVILGLLSTLILSGFGYTFFVARKASNNCAEITGVQVKLEEVKQHQNDMRSESREDWAEQRRFNEKLWSKIK
jgi:hypothetical protein